MKNNFFYVPEAIYNCFDDNQERFPDQAKARKYFAELLGDDFENEIASIVVDGSSSWMLGSNTDEEAVNEVADWIRSSDMNDFITVIPFDQEKKEFYEDVAADIYTDSGESSNGKNVDLFLYVLDDYGSGVIMVKVS